LPPVPAVAWFFGTQLLEADAAVILECEFRLSGKADGRKRKCKSTGNDLPAFERARVSEKCKLVVTLWVDDHKPAMRTTDEVVVHHRYATPLIGDVLVQGAIRLSGAGA
jgi:hypothetical protein